jgi:hypothetical protein
LTKTCHEQGIIEGTRIEADLKNISLSVYLLGIGKWEYIKVDPNDDVKQLFESITPTEMMYGYHGG